MTLTDTAMIDPALASSRRTKVGLAAAGAATCAYLSIVDPAVGLAPPCPFRAATGIDCPGCGLARGLHALLHGDVVRAADHNLLLVLSLPLLVVLAVRWARSTAGRPVAPIAHPLRWSALACVVVVAFWVARVAGPAPLDWLASGVA